MALQGVKRTPGMQQITFHYHAYSSSRLKCILPKHIHVVDNTTIVIKMLRVLSSVLCCMPNTHTFVIVTVYLFISYPRSNTRVCYHTNIIHTGLMIGNPFFKSDVALIGCLNGNYWIFFYSKISHVLLLNNIIHLCLIK